GPDAEGDLEMGVQRAAPALQIEWLPAVEHRGEGVFLQFRRNAISSWLDRSDVRDRLRRLEEGFQAWKRERPESRREFPPPAYVLLHSLSHLLLTAVSLECGYPASSIRERIYAIPEVGYGILL